MLVEMFSGELLHFDSALQAHDPILPDRVFRSRKLEGFVLWLDSGRFMSEFKQNPLLFSILHALQGKKSLYENLFDFFQRNLTCRRPGSHNRSCDLQ